MKMISKVRNHKKLQGAVLFTVVSVLAIMIIFIMATLTVISAVQKRTYSDYAQSQSYYTARSAVDSVVTALRDNNSDVLADRIMKNTNVAFSQDLSINLPESMGRITKLNVSYAGESNYAGSSQNVYKITATARVADDESTVSLYLTHNPVVSNTAIPTGCNAMTAMGAAAIPSNLHVLGGSSLSVESTSPGTTKITNDGSMTGGSVINGNAEFTTQTTVTLSKSEHMVVFGDLDGGSNGVKIYGLYNLSTEPYLDTKDAANNNARYYFSRPTGASAGTGATQAQIEAAKEAERHDISNIPYIYCSGRYSIKYGVGLKAEGVYCPVNIYCGYYQSNTGSDLGNSYGDIYCYNTGDTSTIGGPANDSNIILGWVQSQTEADDVPSPGTAYLGGNFYTKGNLTVGSNKFMTIKGDLVVEGNLIVDTNARLIVDGSLTVKGTFSIASGASVTTGTYYGNKTGAGSITGTKITTATAVFPAAMEKNKLINPDDKAQSAPNVPQKLIPNIYESQIYATSQVNGVKVYNDESFYVFGSPTISTCESNTINQYTIVAAAGNGTNTISYWDNVAKMNKTVTVTGDSTSAVQITPSLKPADNEVLTIESDACLEGSFSNTGVKYIFVDPSNGPINLYLKDYWASSSDAPKIIINDGYASGTKITNRVNIYMSGNFKDYNNLVCASELNTSCILTSYYYDKIYNNTLSNKLAMSKDPTNLFEIPNVYIGIEAQKTLACINNSVISGYIFAPRSNLNFTNGKVVKYAEYNDGVNTYNQNDYEAMVIGSFVFGDISAQNGKSFVAYINSNAGGGGGGGGSTPSLNEWHELYYRNN